jgi:hypothetical protein
MRKSAATAMTEPTDAPPPAGPAPKYTAVDYVFSFITITAGVLIALLINGLVQWNDDRELVTAARATITREIADNKKELDSTIAGMQGDMKKFDAAIQFATEILAAKKTSVHELYLNVNLADLSATGWRTAERTGALSHMDYDEVQRYSKLYDLQDLLVEQQRGLVGRLGETIAILNGSFDPDNPNQRDLELFRERAMALRAHLTVHEQMAKRLAENYAEVLR